MRNPAWGRGREEEEAGGCGEGEGGAASGATQQVWQANITVHQVNGQVHLQIQKFQHLYNRYLPTGR